MKLRAARTYLSGQDLDIMLSSCLEGLDDGTTNAARTSGDGDSDHFVEWQRLMDKRKW